MEGMSLFQNGLSNIEMKFTPDESDISVIQRVLFSYNQEARGRLVSQVDLRKSARVSKTPV